MGQFHVQIRLRNPISSVCDGPNDGRIDGQKDERRVQRTDGPPGRRTGGRTDTPFQRDARRHLKRGKWRYPRSAIMKEEFRETEWKTEYWGGRIMMWKSYFDKVLNFALSDINRKKNKNRGSKDATTLSSLIVHFLSFSCSMDELTDGPTFLCHFWIVLDCLLVHFKFRRHRNIGKDVFRRSKITPDGRTDWRTDGHDLL